MTDQERINTEVREKLLVHDEKFNSVITKMDATNQRVDDLIGEFREFKQEMRDFKQEMRDKDNQRTEDMREIRNSVSSIIKHVQVLTFTAIGAIAAMVITVILK